MNNSRQARFKLQMENFNPAVRIITIQICGHHCMYVLAASNRVLYISEYFEKVFRKLRIYSLPFANL